MKYDVATLFFTKRDKVCFRRVYNYVRTGTVSSDLSLAKSISSIITHILIEMEGTEDKEEIAAKALGYRLYDWLDLQRQLISGVTSKEEALSTIKSMLEVNNEG